MKTTLLSLGFLAASSLAGHAALIWTGASDGSSLFTEANWLDDNNAIPADNTINSGSAVTAATGGLIQISSGTGTPGAYGGNFDIGLNNNLEVSGGKTLASSGSSGIRVDGSGTPSPLSAASIFGASIVNVQFSVGIGWSVNESSTLRFRGGGNPLNNSSTVDLLDTGSVLLFDAETYAAFDTEHSSKVTANGAALIFGADPFAVEAGDNALATAYNGALGVQISMVPEPSSTALLGLGGLALILRRRK